MEGEERLRAGAGRTSLADLAIGTVESPPPTEVPEERGESAEVFLEESAEDEGIQVEDLVEEGLGFDPNLVDAFALEEKDFRDQEGLEYPSLLLSNVLFMDCLKVLKSQKRQSVREMQTWIALPGGEGYQCIGTLQLDSDMLVILKHLRIGATLYVDRDDVWSLNLDDPETLLKFV